MGIEEVIWTIQNISSDWRNFLDIFLVAAVFFGALQLVKGTRAATVLRGIAISLLIMWALSTLLNLQAFSFLLQTVLTATLVAVPVIFQDELRRWLDRVGRIGLVDIVSQIGEERQAALITELRDAARAMSRLKHGALIVIERDTGLAEYINTGVEINARPENQLIQTIFFPKTSLHDGAMIIRGDKIVAVACTLPVSNRRNMPDPTMGLRHRAGLGISEVSDAIVIIVSEESGKISVVSEGRFIRGIDADRLAIILNEFIKMENQRGVPSWFSSVISSLPVLGKRKADKTDERKQRVA